MHLGGLDMALTKYKLEQLIEPCDERNSAEKYTLDDVKGISTGKEFIDTKANMDGVSLTSYKVVEPGDFAYVADTSRRGEKIAIAFNNSEKAVLISSIYTVFRIFRTDLLLSDYLFMYFNRPEFDRYARFNSWGSARETFDWDTMCDIDLELPDVPVQQKYVDIYKAMVANQQSYEHGLEDLKLVCDGYIEDLRRKMPCEKIEPYIKAVGEKNSDNQITLEQGININKEFITPQRSNSDLSSRVIVRKGQIAYCTQLNNANVAIALREGDDCVVSPVYSVIEVIDKNKLLPQYLMLWLIRPEWGRFVYWAATGSAYEFVQYESVCNTEIPIPDIKTQQRIVDIFNVYKTRKQINEKLKSQIKNICPILIRGSLEEK